MVDDSDDKTGHNIYPLGRDVSQESKGGAPEVDEPSKTTKLVALDLQDWTTAREALARLESKLESAQEDVRRSVEYARGLEEECDRLADLQHNTKARIAEIHAELDEERGRRLEAQKQCEHLTERLEELSGMRGRYHLERGRREQAQEENQALSEQNDTLRRDLEILSEALKEAKAQGFRFELGPLSVEFKP